MGANKIGHNKAWPWGVQRNAMDAAICKSMTNYYGCTFILSATKGSV